VIGISGSEGGIPGLGNGRPERHIPSLLSRAKASPQGGSIIKRTVLAIATMIGASISASNGLAPPPGAAEEIEQRNQLSGRRGLASVDGARDLSKPPPTDEGE
jgi:hypothetical protein